ncbi:MAG: ABC transporter permease [Candidatus Lindowbacteria bacterium]|nr:ABC transporter permease [Candidatus Lindowbacteria bacterium]
MGAAFYQGALVLPPSLLTLVWRDVTVRYKQAIIGMLWAVIQPVCMMMVLTVFFGKLVKVESGGVPYAVFSYTALLSWNLFSKGFSSAACSLVTNETIITKVYFPRILVPTSALGTGLVDYLISFTAFIPLLLWYQIGIRPQIIYMPLFIALNILSALGFAYFLSIMDSMYRDVRLALPFLTQVFFFLTPVVYPSSEVHGDYTWLYWLNPMAGVVEGMRWCLLDYPKPATSMLVLSSVTGLLLFVLGVVFFQKFERKIVDRI